MVGATLASIRYYCPDTPICLTVDGDFDVSDLEAQYDLVILRISEMEDQEMARFIARSFHAKHAAMWEGPFEFYLWLDCDALLWGDLTPKIKTDIDFQILWDEISVPADAGEIPEWMLHYMFDPIQLKSFDPDFEWRGHPYFCAGVFACRRNVIPFEKYREVESWRRDHPGVFAWGDMGMFNYLIHSLAQQGKITTAMSDLQNIPVYNGKEELVIDTTDSGWRFPEEVSRPRIAHFCGRKPNVFDFKAYDKPFTIARLEHYRQRYVNLIPWIVILWIDGCIATKKIWGKLKRRFGQ